MSTTTTPGYIGIPGRAETFLSASDFVDAKDSHDAIAVLVNNTNDYLIGGLGKDLIIGNAGDDTIIGDQSWNDETTNANPDLAAAADLILGDGQSAAFGSGRDTIYARGGNNYVNAGAGDDYVMGGSGNEYL